MLLLLYVLYIYNVVIIQLCVTAACYCSTYVGDVVDGLRHGVGTFVDTNGKLSYTGEWHLGKRHGKVCI